MSRGWMEWAPYVPVAERRRQAEKLTAKLRKQGKFLAPVVISGRAISSTFWGKAWCGNLEAYRDYESRLPRGRSYVRNGAVIDLQIAPGEVRALVNGSALYKTSVTIRPLAQPAWRRLCADCAGRIDSLVELLQGRFSKAIMERLCRQDTGIFPRPAEIRFDCSCPDHALMCKHVAAVLYGVGARLDEQPDLLFRLRAVEGAELVAGATADLTLVAGAPAADRMLRDDDVAALFGLDMTSPTAPATPAKPNTKPQGARPPRSRTRAPAASPSVPPAATNTAKGVRSRAAADAAGGAKGRKPDAAVATAGRGAAMTGMRASTAGAKPTEKTRRSPNAGPAAAPANKGTIPKTSAGKAVTRARPGQSMSKPSRADGPTQKTSSIPAFKVSVATGAPATVRPKSVRSRAVASWKTRAAVRKAKRKA
ncbi:SWIM zinc finger family protein [Paracraurococcus lichenis]|uniref:SWIM-type domain-containing protein n=1 Tax=Paracraurococcus lichenis TaxID=3064888 RepID=A0ABT9EB25_9PROT|nr:SWIM zinc finger family protein [Paracraurococcus sp. LOR1-02]MDO9713388.1 hypothetical protein [Paracraurococcus sp. LOR1-02]